ncbi:hypothetical protein ACFVYV_39280 [Streptomyces mirabilis]|uniref:hypothetical protein n=1 Tax=Streptomyces TaxID=1883 RepID=UPI000BB16061|nr:MULTISPECIES: hypothetical protein [unclassified Streptomyces]
MTRRPHSQNRRPSLLALTEAGRQLLDAATPTFENALRTWLADPLTARSLEQLAHHRSGTRIHVSPVDDVSGLLAIAMRGGELVDDLQPASVLAAGATGCPVAVRRGHELPITW